ncbi:MAG: hypothetical protein L3J65_08375 [Robiginitomaculum sp.]|nr:hypothetical protein [Robiginitomaculum sp.]
MGDNKMIYTGFSIGMQRMFLVLAVVLATVIVVKSVTPALPSLSISNMDKVIHVLAYLILGLVTLPALSRFKPLMVWIGLCGFGASIEVAQGLMSTGRSADIFDGIANAGGAFLALVSWRILTLLIRKPI